MDNSDEKKLSQALPSESDFDPYGGDLDAQCAWKHFGGLTLKEAAIRFRERPDIYQEDFMFMGGKAFAFYFSVIDDYLRNAPETNEGDDHEAWILAHCIKNQFERNAAHHVLDLAPCVIALTKFVLQNTYRFGFDAAEQKRIADAWVELATHIETLTQA